MASKWVRFNGKAKWARVYVPDNQFGVKWKITLVVTPETIKEMKAVGLNKQVTSDKDGDDVVTFHRDAVKKIKGDDVFFCPPSIYDKDGKALVEYYNKQENKRVTQFSKEEKPLIEQRGKQVQIGNGSDVELTVVIYDAGIRKGSRLESIKIIDLIEYVREESELANADGIPFDLDPVIEIAERPAAVGADGW